MLSVERTLEFTRSYKVSPQRLWCAITSHKEMVQWYFDNIPDFQAKVGFTTKFPVEAPSQIFVHNWEVTQVIQRELIAYTWTFDDTPGRGSTTWKVSPDNEGAQLVLIDQIHESYPDDVPEFKRESAEGGWTYFLDERLKSYMEV